METFEWFKELVPIKVSSCNIVNILNIVLWPSEVVTSAVLHGSVMIRGQDKCFQRMTELLATIVLVFYRVKPAQLYTRAGFGPCSVSPPHQPPPLSKCGRAHAQERQNAVMAPFGEALCWYVVAFNISSSFRITIVPAMPRSGTDAEYLLF